jgi:RNA polymerase sigma factor (sigma-70 family)
MHGHLKHDLEPIAATPGEESELVDLLPGVRRFFRRRVTASDADDLTQEVYLHMRARARSTAIKNLRGYLLTVAANVFNEKARGDRVRRKATHVAFEDAGHSAEQNTPEHIVLQRDQIKVMLAVIQELPTRTRDVFLLHRFDGMTYHAIAHKMGMSSSGVEKHIMKALRHLTQRLKETNA